MVFQVVMYGCESWTINKADHKRNYVFHSNVWQNSLQIKKKKKKEIMVLNCGVGEDSWESLG